MSKKITLFLLLIVGSFGAVQAQSADDVLRYSLEYPAYDPVSLVLPAVTTPTGFGAYQENPATMALFEEGFFSFSLSSRYVDESATYLNNTSTFSDNQTGIADIGLVHKVPTVRGSLVIGGGYSQTTDFNRAFSVSGRNAQSTITDFFNTTPDDSLFFAAFDAYAIDYATNDSTFAETASIFRVGLAQFPGINQDVEMVEKGQMGEYSAFFATEIVRNLSIGASIGYLSGTYSYQRDFLESDRNNDYNFPFIDTDGDGVGDTDVDHILATDQIDAELQAFNARLGTVYQVAPSVTIGASYEFPSSVRVDEDYNTEITTTLDNGVTYSDDAPGYISYKVVRPSRLKAGATFTAPNGLLLAGSIERVQYSEGRLEFEEIELNPEENNINNIVESSFNDVLNIRAGLEYKIKQFTPRIGFAYFPSPQETVGSARRFVSGGFSASLTRGLLFNLGLQYSFWEDHNTLYSTPDVSEVVQEEVTRLNVMAGIKMIL